MFVGCIVVDDQMNLEFRRNALVQAAKKRQKLLMPMPGLALSENSTGGDIQCGKKSSGPVADVIVGNAFDIAEPHRQDRLSTVQSLDLTLFVHTEHQRVIGRIEVESRYIAHLFDEERIGGQLEGARSMRLNRKGLKEPVNR